MSGAALISGVVVAAHGRHYVVDTGDRLITCFVRGKRSEVACGDRVAAQVSGDRQGVIEALDPRASLFQRAAPHRRKLIAANVTQVAMVVATHPSFSDEIVARVHVAAESQGLSSLIVLNKCDLPAESARARLAPFVAAGYRVCEISAIDDVAPLRGLLSGERTVLVGQSGMGKSTIVNALVPEAGARTGEISRFLASGRHTTAAVTAYRLPDGGGLIDCPGFQEFGLAHLTLRDIVAGFVDFHNFGGCRFPNCRHAGEPACAVARAVAEGKLDGRRLELFRRIVAAEGAT